jgi:hypothetical protein
VSIEGRKIRAMVIMLALVVAPSATAGRIEASLAPPSYSWNGGDGYWSVKANWTPNTGAPGAGDDAYLQSYGTATYNVNIKGVGLTSLTIRGDSSSSGSPMTLSMTGKTLWAQSETIGGNGADPASCFNQSGGTNKVTGPGSLTIDNNGIYNLSGGTLNTTGGALDSAGAFDWSGGTLKFTDIDVSGGSFTVPTLTVGSGKTFTQTGGAFGWTKIDLSGTGIFTVPTLTVGKGQTFSQTGNKSTFDWTSIALSGGTLSVPTLDVTSSRTFTQSGGTLNGNISNSGTVNFTGGTSTVNGNVTNNGTMSATNSTIGITGTFFNNGAFVADPFTGHFGTVNIGTTGYIQASAGDTFYISKNFVSTSTQKTLWNTTGATLDFMGSGSHNLYITGADLGQTVNGYTNNFSWGTLAIATGNKLNLKGSLSKSGALYVNDLVGLTFNKAGTKVTDITGNGFNIYYNPTDDPGLKDKIYALTGGGSLAPVPIGGSIDPVPIPASWLLLGSGLLGLIGLGLRRKKT